MYDDVLKEELENLKNRNFLLTVSLVIVIFFASVLSYQLNQFSVQNNLLRQKIDGLEDEKKWIWRNAVTERIEYGEPRIEFDRIIVPVIGLSRENETLFVANASLPFRTEDCALLIHNGSLYGYATGELKWKVDSLKADLEFYREQYTRYFQKYMDTQRGLLPLISNQTAFLPLWDVSMQIMLSNIRYEYPLFSLNRTIQVRIDYYSFNKTYGYCRVEARNFTWINHASFPILQLNMINGTYARVEWRLISGDETKYVIQQSLRLVNVTFADGITYRHVDLTLNHMIPKSEGDPWRKKVC